MLKLAARPPYSPPSSACVRACVRPNHRSVGRPAVGWLAGLLWCLLNVHGRDRDPIIHANRMLLSPPPVLLHLTTTHFNKIDQRLFGGMGDEAGGEAAAGGGQEEGGRRQGTLICMKMMVARVTHGL